MKKTFYELLGVPPTANRDLIGMACKRRLAKLEESATEEAKAEAFAIREAWSTLGDEKLRAAYDARLANPQAEALLDARAAAFAEKLGPEGMAAALIKPREVPRNWSRVAKLLSVGMAGLMMVGWVLYSKSAREQRIERTEAATWEAETGEKWPGREKAAAAARGDSVAEPAKAAGPGEPFSAEKFEQEMGEKEAAIREQVATDQQKQEDEFRRKQAGEESPRSRRRVRDR